jgi:hypothetical protein
VSLSKLCLTAPPSIIEGELCDIESIAYHPHNDLSSEKGQAQDQTEAGEISGTTNSSVLLPDPNVDIKNWRPTNMAAKGNYFFSDWL